jgi:hypothetical protein
VLLCGGLALALVGLAGCGHGDSTDPGSAKSCEQLVDRAARVARQVVDDLQGKSAAELTAQHPDDPFTALTAPFEPFQARADQLGCDRGELRRLACTAYQGIEPTGPLTEEFLARVDEVCR